jgi:prepilin-type N-terminal cleavage/methylation domain-containing protein
MDRMRIMKDRGITLIELIIVISIIGILLIALGFSFEGWMGAYRVESQTKEMYVDLMNARARAMQRNRVHFVNFPTATSYTIYEDDSDGTNKVPDGDGTLQTGTGNGADTQLPSFPKTVQYNIRWSWSGASNQYLVNFDNRGIVQPESNPLGGTICISSTTTATNQDYDCIEISQLRINMGKLTTQISAGGACNATNCVAK